MALDFNGSADYLQLGSVPISGPPLTMVGWANVDNITVNHPLITIHDGTGTDGWFLGLRGDVAGDIIRATSQQAGTPRVANTDTGYSANTWVHAGGIFRSSTNRQAYINGVGGSVVNTQTSVPGTTSVTQIATNNSGTTLMDGRAAEVAIWDVDLTDAEMLLLAAGYCPKWIRPSSLVFYPPLIRSGVINLCGGALSVTGSPAASPHPRIIYDRGFQNFRFSRVVIGVLRPNADVTDGSWTDQAGGTNLFAAIDEAAPDDSDYIQSSLNPTNDMCEVALSNPAGGLIPPYRVSYRYKKPIGRRIDLEVRLVQGTTVIATWTHNDIGTDFVEVTQTLTSGEAANVTDVSDLRLRFTANAP